jgi:undecaprenyl-diphosphatase
MAVAGVLFALTANLVIIMNYYHPRPFMDHTVTQLIAHAPETSFPSDHATFMFTLSFMLATSRRFRAIGVPLVVLSTVCSLSRVFCGVHYPLDIAGSLMVSLITAGLFRSPSSRRISLLITLLLGKFDIIAAKLTVARRH